MTIGITPLDYVNIAVSQDEGRWNMTGAYREKDVLVATDGHRLHMVSGLAMQAQGGFVDGRDSQFPCYEAVIPKNPKTLATVKFNRKQIAQLNKVQKLFSHRSIGTKFTFHRDKLRIEASEEGSESQGAWSITLTFDCDTEYQAEYTVGLNLRYFVEALIPNMPMKFSSENNKGPQLLKLDLGSSEYTAIIMPIRLD